MNCPCTNLISNIKFFDTSKELIKKEIPLIQKFYTKTFGQIKFDRKKGRTPAKGSIVECVVKCSATRGCHCVR